MALWQFVKTGGITLYILIACSVLSVAIMIERLIYYHRMSRVKREDFMTRIAKELKQNNVQGALEVCEDIDTPITRVVSAGLGLYNNPTAVISHGMEREIRIETTRLERYTGIVGTLGSTAVYIGLFGTVLGIIRAFHDISESGSGGIQVVIKGISEALVCTAAGLCVAVPAVIAYNYFVKKVDRFITDMELCASEFLDLLAGVKRQ